MLNGDITKIISAGGCNVLPGLHVSKLPPEQAPCTIILGCFGGRIWRNPSDYSDLQVLGDPSQALSTITMTTFLNFMFQP